MFCFFLQLGYVSHKSNSCTILNLSFEKEMILPSQPDALEGMLMLTETSLLVLSDFKRINQGLPVLCLLQTTYHSYTKHYWLRMPTRFPCFYSHSVLNPVMLWKKAYFSFGNMYPVYTSQYAGYCVYVVGYMCARISDFYCCCQVFPCLHLLVVAAFHRISASVLQNPTVDRRDDVFLPWLVVGAGALQSCFKAVRLAQ